MPMDKERVVGYRIVDAKAVDPNTGLAKDTTLPPSYNGFATWAYAPLNRVYAPIGGEYQISNQYPDYSFQKESGVDQIVIRSTIKDKNGKDRFVSAVVTGINFSGQAFNATGHIEQGAELGVSAGTLAVAPAYWPYVAFAIYIDGLGPIDPVVAAREFPGGLIWPQGFQDQKSKPGFVADDISTRANEELQPETPIVVPAKKEESGGVGTLLAIGFGLKLLFGKGGLLSGKGKRR